MPSITEARPAQSSKAEMPISVTELGISIEVSPLQFLKAASLIEMTELPNVIDVRPVQPSKAEMPISVTELGISIEVSSLHRRKA